jgi:hypothetical protein
MSATAEELASQAGQLQSAVAFFTVTNGAAPAAHKITMARPAQPKIAAPIKHSGVAINMGHAVKGKADHWDHEFEKF